MQVIEKNLGKVVVDAELWAFLESNIGQQVNPNDLPKGIDYFDFNQYAEFMGMAKIEFPAHEDCLLDDWDALAKWIDTLPPAAECIFDREDVEVAMTSESLSPRKVFKSFKSLKEVLVQEIVSKTDLEYALACVEVIHEDKSLHLLFTNLDWPDMWPFEVVKTVNGNADCKDCYYYE